MQAITAYFCRNLYPIRVFYITTAVFVVAGLVLLFVFPQGKATAWANSNYNPFLDVLFSSWTYLAEWPVIVAAILSCFYLNTGYGLASGLLFAIQALFISTLKTYLNAARPLIEFGDAIHQVDGITVLSQHSFPSGHTAAAFLGMGLLSMNIKKRSLQVLFAIIAAGVGYSRLYLGQHYLADIVAGASIAGILLMLYFRLLPKILTLTAKIRYLR